MSVPLMQKLAMQTATRRDGRTELLLCMSEPEDEKEWLLPILRRLKQTPQWEQMMQIALVQPNNHSGLCIHKMENLHSSALIYRQHQSHSVSCPTTIFHDGNKKNQNKCTLYKIYRARKQFRRRRHSWVQIWFSGDLVATETRYSSAWL